MNFVTVNNNKEQLNELKALLCTLYADSYIVEFTDPMAAAKYILNNLVDTVFAEGEMKRVDGIVLRDIIHKSKPNLRVIVTDIDDSEDICDSDIILVRPITKEKIKQCMEK